jgi:ABC-type transport system substrate-binding protein
MPAAHTFSYNRGFPRLSAHTFKLRQNVLFHDGSPLSSADVKASYERIIHPPQGVLSVRQADYAAITSIDTPDPATVIFHLQWPDAATACPVARYRPVARVGGACGDHFSGSHVAAAPICGHDRGPRR